MLTLVYVVYVTLIALWPALLVLAIIARRSPAPERWARWFRISRRILGLWMVQYAVVKFTGAQLHAHEVSTRLSDLRPDELFWYFFGYSRPYVLFLGAAELFCGALLLWPRFDRLGVLIALALLANIVSLDFAYHVGRVAFWASGFLVGAVANIVFEPAPYLGALRALAE